MVDPYQDCRAPAEVSLVLEELYFYVEAASEAIHREYVVIIRGMKEFYERREGYEYVTSWIIHEGSYSGGCSVLLEGGTEE